jgi:nicotinamidase-related amidase
MKALIVIDVQVAIFAGFTPLDVYPQVVSNIQSLTARARAAKVPVIYVQHHDADGGGDSPFAHGAPGWQLDPRLDVQPGDAIVHKTAPDSFFETTLQETLQAAHATELVVCGCWTNYCVDTTCRRAVSLGYNVQLASDAHACANSPVLNASQIVAHHNNILDGLAAGAAKLVTKASADIIFG